MQKKTIKKKKFEGYRMMILSRHPSHATLRTDLPKLPFRTCIRFGSTTVLEDGITLGGKRVEINEVKGIRNSANKLLMKRCFTEASVKTADWFTCMGNDIFVANTQEKQVIEDLKFPVIVKSLFGSRNEGNTFIESAEDLQKFIASHNMNNYIIEVYKSFTREYRLHINAIDEICFYTCRKMLKRDTAEDEKWHRHDDNSVWIMDTNPAFDKPVNWNDIVAECVKAAKALQLDVCGFDVKVQSAKDGKDRMRENPDFFIIESGSACSHGTVTTQKYIEELPKIAKAKAKLHGII